MAVRDDRNIWYQCQHTTNQGFFLCNGGTPYQGNVDVRVTGSNNQVLTTSNIFTNDNFVGDRNFGKNFGVNAGSPTPRPTPRPVQSSRSPIRIRLGNPQNPMYYLVFFINGLNCGSISNVEYIDQTNYKTYHPFTVRYGNTEFQFNNNGNPFTNPGQLRITNTNGKQIETGYIINNFNAGTIYYIQHNFC